jgi:polysaccharide deacetylase family protein (PEP-CTERM system associated)
MGSKKSAFTVDVEDGISLAMLHDFGVESPQTERVVAYTRTILNLLEENQTKGTFFVLGKVAEVFPFLITEIADAGHELGVHGYHHFPFFKMSREMAFEEISSAKKLIEDISGVEVLGHRAPAFSITPETEWGLDVIAEAGFTYDSSIMPIDGKRYGWPGYNRDMCKITTPSGDELIEVPMSVSKILGKELPVCGGGYLRLYPYSLTKWSFEKISRERPVILYMHPYELDTERYPHYYFEQLNKVSFKKKLRMKSMWWNRETVYPKLKALLEEYDFDTMENIIQTSDLGAKTIQQ